MKRLPICFAIILCLFGCKKHEGSTEVKNVVIEMDSVIVNTTIGYLSSIIASNDTVLVAQCQGDSLVYYLSAKNGQLLGKSLSVGQGPGEVVGPLNVQYTNGKMFIYDRPVQTLYEANGFKFTDTQKKIKVPVEISQLFALPDGNFIGALAPTMANDATKERFTFLDNSGKEIYKFGSYPSFNNDEKNNKIPLSAISSFHQTRGFYAIDNNSFIVSTSHVLSLYKKTGDKFELVKEVECAPYSYDYTEASNIMSSSTSIADGFAPGFRTGLENFENNIYLIFKKNKEDKSPTIYAYDFDLNKTAELTPSSAVSNICTFDKDGRLIFVEEKGDDTFLYKSKKPVSDLF